MNLDKNEQRIYSGIWEYYYELHHRDYDKASKAIRDLQITDLKCGNDYILMELRRPGLLISKRGENYEDLKTHLQLKQFHVFETKGHLIEDLIIPMYLHEEDFF